jgi:hypothetical protein
MLCYSFGTQIGTQRQSCPSRERIILLRLTRNYRHHFFIQFLELLVGLFVSNKARGYRLLTLTLLFPNACWSAVLHVSSLTCRIALENELFF